MNKIISILFFLIFLQFSEYRPSLLFCEEWKETPAQIPVTQEHVANSYLSISTYGESKNQLKKSHHDNPDDDPYYIWSGLCKSNWALTLKHNDYYADLSKYGRVRWRSKQSGFHQLRLILKLGDGSWIISETADGPSKDWRVFEFIVENIRWRTLNIETIQEGEWIEKPDISKVDEIGFTDLMSGGESVACSRVDWIEVYAFTVNRIKE